MSYLPRGPQGQGAQEGGQGSKKRGGEEEWERREMVKRRWEVKEVGNWGEAVEDGGNEMAVLRE